MTIQHGQNRPHRSLALPIILLSLLVPRPVGVVVPRPVGVIVP